MHAIIIMGTLLGISFAAMAVEYARWRPSSIFHRPAAMVYRLARGIGEAWRHLWPLAALFGLMLVFEQCQADAYKRGYEAHQEQCWVDLRSCARPR
jgi:hypothetical protein